MSSPELLNGQLHIRAARFNKLLKHVFRMNKHGNARRILQPLLMAGVIGSAISIAAATLSVRPRVEAAARTPPIYQQADFQQSLRQLNRQLDGLASQAELEVAPPADTLAVARRISLALVGSGLSLEEVRALALISEPEQIRWWTSHLLNDRRWADYFAERLSRAWVGTNDGPFLLFRRRKFNTWLADQLAAGVGYDRIVRAMLTSDGLWTDTPPVNFITATMDEANEGRADPIRLAGRVSRSFLAQRIDCLQCHDDFLGELNFGSFTKPIDGTQEHFHQLAAFFSGTSLHDPVFKGIGEDGGAYEYQFLGSTEPVTVTPAVPFLGELLPAAGEPRVRLAEWITHPDNRAFSRATVNRVWALLFSRPLVSPVDNIPLDDSVPEVLDLLARDFATHQFDLRRLIRLIVESDAFQRSSRAEFEITLEHEQAWAIFPVTQLRPEQVAGSLFQACKLAAIDSKSSIFTRLKAFGDTQDFLKRFGDLGEDEFTTDAVTITQRLLLMNGNLVAERTKVDFVNNASSRIAALVSDDAQAVELAFLSVLNRRPTASELETFKQHLSEKRGTARTRGLGDIFWAMINSTEFSWNH